MVTGPRTSSVGVVLIERGDPPYDEIPADRSDNLYDEINPRVPGSTNQLDSGSSLDSKLCASLSHVTFSQSDPLITACLLNKPQPLVFNHLLGLLYKTLATD